MLLTLLDAANDTAAFIQNSMVYIITILGLLIVLFIVYLFIDVGLIGHMLKHVDGWQGFHKGYTPPTRRK